MRMANAPRAWIIGVCSLYLIAAGGCSLAEEQGVPLQSAHTAAVSAAAGTETSPAQADAGNVRGQAERPPAAHPAAFVPEQVREGDTVAGLRVKSVEIGSDPMYYVIVNLEGSVRATGYYYRSGGTVHFQPDQSSLERLPHVQDQYVLHYRDGVKVPRTVRFTFEDGPLNEQLPSSGGVGWAEIEMTDYEVRYVPEANSAATPSVLKEDRIYVRMGERLIPFGFRYVEDAAEPVKAVRHQHFHSLEDAGGLVQKDAHQWSWKGLRVRLELIGAWGAGAERPNLSGIVGNHAELLSVEETQAAGSGNLYAVVAERDRWDDEIGHYNGVEYEYWIIALREDPLVKLAGDDYMHAFCLVGVSDRRDEAGMKAMLELVRHWKVPPENFYMPAFGYGIMGRESS